ncbi:MAG: urease accessory protein UreE [Candidatus Poribacteria bacterium]|nr:urease accessory protein UreE [Candidatus Poribacteria bacterium]MDE0503873.1 urease accessory protein UreE [Candidatus Poribacteria bacterium]
MLLAQEIVTEVAKVSSLERDVVKLDWESRQKCRQRLKSEAGREIGLALPTGTVLLPGNILYRDAEVEIVVEGAPEKVFVLRPESTEDYGLTCYQIGNLHRAIGFDNGAILVPYEPVLENQFCRLGFQYTIEERTFTHAARQSAPHAHAH